MVNDITSRQPQTDDRDGCIDAPELAYSDDEYGQLVDELYDLYKDGVL